MLKFRATTFSIQPPKRNNGVLQLTYIKNVLDMDK